MRLQQYTLSAMIALTFFSRPICGASSGSADPPPCKGELCALSGASGAAVKENATVDKSALMRKELDSIKKSEAAAAVQSRKENLAMEKVKAELDEIDSQVTAMKLRMEKGIPRSNDRVDVIKAMSAYKAEHAVQLEELRKKHKENGQKQLEEINKLKQAFNAKWSVEIYAAVGRYQQVATNKYLRHKRDAAWDSLLAEFSDAGGVKRHDVVAFLAKAGVVMLPGMDQSCHIDNESGLMWVKTANLAGKAMAWSAAVYWAAALDYGGYSDWRLPTADELMTLAKRGGQRPADFLNKSGFSNVQTAPYWTSTASLVDGNSLHRNVNMGDGTLEEGGKQNEYHVWPVRETGLKRQKVRLEAKD